MTNPIKPTIKTEIFSLVLILLSIITASYLYFVLPQRVPVHWNFAGQVDRWGSGQAQAIFFPILIIGMYLLFVFIPLIDPKKDRYQQFAKIYQLFKNLILAFFFIIYLIASLNGLGYQLPVAVWVPLLVGFLFMVLGNYFGKIKPNWFVGIRTPWTLSSEEVWNKTHRFGGKIFILAGLMIAAEAFLPVNWRLAVFIIAIVIALVGTIGSSYYFYYLEHKSKKNGNN